MSKDKEKDIILRESTEIVLPENVVEKSLKRNKRDNTITATEVTDTEDEIILKQIINNCDGSKELRAYITPKKLIKNKESRSKKIKQMTDSGMSQVDTAKAINMSQSTVSKTLKKKKK